jgi:hypothetical protein
MGIAAGLTTLGALVALGRWSIGVATLTGLGLGATALLNMASAPLVGRLSDRVATAGAWYRAA